MWRHARCISWWFVRPLAGVLASSACAASAQTIADYSRAQRAMLENAMAQAAARSAGQAASAATAAGPASVPSPAMAGPAAAAPAVAPQAALPAPAPIVQVSGVFASSAGVLAEVVVDATAYLLRAGESVPGTPWHVEAVAIDRVVLGRPGHPGRSVAADGEGGRRVFALPALR